MTSKNNGAAGSAPNDEPTYRNISKTANDPYFVIECKQNQTTVCMENIDMCIDVFEDKICIFVADPHKRDIEMQIPENTNIKTERF